MTIDNQFSSDKRQAPTKTKRFGDDPYTQELKVLKADLAFLKEAWADAERRSQELDAILRFRLGELRTWKGLLRFMRRSVGLGQSDINTEMRKQGRAAIQQIIPHANERGSALENQAPANDLCIAVFCFDRPTYLGHVLKSLGKQSALHLVHVIIDGHQGNPAKREETERVVKVAKQHGVGQIHRHYGNLGFRKLMISALEYLSARYRQLIIIEDDCFPTASAIETFKEELREIENDPSIFSVYGHPFGVPNERTGIARFQGWGWATTSEKLKPILEELKACYMMSEPEFVLFATERLSPEILRRIDVTPPRLPSKTLKRFFAWDETLCLLCAMRNLRHRMARQRIIYNFGMSSESTHFDPSQVAQNYFRRPPFNMISEGEVWDYFDEHDA